MEVNTTKSYNGLETSGVWHWSAPCLLVGICAVVVLIAALIIARAFSYLKNADDVLESSEVQHGESVLDEEWRKVGNTGLSWHDEQMEEEVTVVMAGDEKPSFLATPIMLGNQLGMPVRRSD
ncbi:hypothetical protein SUGI_0896090 [Cryptomeria japonica]|nr:hypothetical protein SUGI_0896090 [Cryptomeria japonica]